MFMWKDSTCMINKENVMNYSMFFSLLTSIFQESHNKGIYIYVYTCIWKKKYLKREQSDFFFAFLHSNSSVLHDTFLN